MKQLLLRSPGSRRKGSAARGLSIAALGCGVPALLLSLWIVVPAPAYGLWLVALLASEWSLYVGVLALGGVLLGAAALARGRVRAGAAAAACGTLALGLSLYPLLTTLPVASSRAADLSLVRYLQPAPGPRAAPQTFTYAMPGGQPLGLDVYRPAVPAAPGAPAVVVVHGGAWKSGRRSDFPQWNAWLSGQGYVVFDIDYRLAPQPNWRTALADVQEAVRWVRAHAARFGVDPGRIALLGRSAGGHLALLAAYTAPGRGKAPSEEGAEVQAVVAFYAPTDLAWGYHHPANPRVIDGPATLRQFTGGTPERIPEVYEQASPVAHVGPETPPTLLIHGGADQLVRSEHTRLLAEALRRVGRQEPACDVLLLPYAQHGFDYHFNGWGAQVAQQVLLGFLATHLGAPQP